VEPAKDGDSICYLQRIGNHFPDHTVSYPGRPDSKKVVTFETDVAGINEFSIFVIYSFSIEIEQEQG
jgi:hypothetical protein